MMGWRLETADGVDIPVSFNPGSSSVVADLQELPSMVHSASWVAPASYLGDKVTVSCCPPALLLDLLHHCTGIIYWMSGRKVLEVQVTKTEELRLITNAEDGEAEGVRASGSHMVAHQQRKSCTRFFLIFT